MKIPSRAPMLFYQALLLAVVKLMTEFHDIIKILSLLSGAIDMLGFFKFRSKNLTTMGSSSRRVVCISMKRVG